VQDEGSGPVAFEERGALSLKKQLNTCEVKVCGQGIRVAMALLSACFLQFAS